MVFLGDAALDLGGNKDVAWDSAISLAISCSFCLSSSFRLLTSNES